MDQPTDIVVINPEPRMHDLAHYTDEPRAPIKDGKGNELVVPREYAHYHVLPGLNFVPVAVLERAGVVEHSALRIDEDLARLPPTQAKALASESCSAPALRRWLAMEKARAADEKGEQARKLRQPVIAAIEKRLLDRRVKEVA